MICLQGTSSIKCFIANMLLVFGLVTFLISECYTVSENIQVVRTKEISIECASNTDFTFKLYSNGLNDSLTIAECDFNRKSCVFLTNIYENIYTILYTGRGGILVIRYLNDETVGTYQCHETYNPMNFVSTMITQSEYADAFVKHYRVPPKTTGSGGVLHIKSLNDESFGTYICYETYNPNIFVSIEIISHIMDAANSTYNVTDAADTNTENHWDQGGTNNSSSILVIVLSVCSALAVLGIVCVIVYCTIKDFHCAASYDIDNFEMSASTKYATAPYQNEENENTAAPLLCSTIRRSSDSKHPLTKHAYFAETHTESALPSVRAVAAIELGTTYSGCAFSFSQDPNNVVVNTNWFNGGESNLIATKTPTIVLLDNKGEFHSFGFDAEKHFLSLAHDNNHRGWRLFRRFRMALQKKYSLDATIDDLEGNPYPAMEIFKYAIQYMLGHLLKAMKLASPTLLESNIQYIVTVPAIWTAEAINFMRESAVKAGITNERLTLVVESAAVASWWTRLNIKDSPYIDMQTTGSKWIVVKLGGGSTSVLAYEVLPEGKVKVIQQASGGAWGFTNVEEQFMDDLQKELESGNVDKLRRENIGDYYELLQDIAETTQSKYILLNDICVLRLPYSLSPILKHRIETAKIKIWFDSEISSVIAHIKSVLNNNVSLREVTSMVVVGSFAESLYVQKMLREIFPQFKVIVPENQGFAVLKGAVSYGHSTIRI
ncbi:heat shock 70 kDa protein 12B-like isoform X2 [Dreissena polymorpha]|uniref:heat shock 70 kDa protein 12B-like isoform X2 n=1 Tax=Dreissena polymorpha TaxID=45954 RepID=UPI0022642C8E|nr:heat shock 70 kDa protein 12B-like isoform X2 [Dreissena polymorpha]